MILTNSNVNAQGNLGEDNLESQLTEPSQISNEIQMWTQIIEQKKNDRTVKLRAKWITNVAILKKRINEGVSTVTNPSSKMNEIQSTQPSGSKNDKSIGVHASNNENSGSEDKDYLLKASEIKDLKHPAKPLCRKGLNLDTTIVSNEDSEEEDCHK